MKHKLTWGQWLLYACLGLCIGSIVYSAVRADDDLYISTGTVGNESLDVVTYSPTPLGNDSDVTVLVGTAGESSIESFSVPLPSGARLTTSVMDGESVDIFTQKVSSKEKGPQ